MTKDEILAMKPGPELDRLVAEVVMGWKSHCRNTAFYVASELEFSSSYLSKAEIDNWSPSKLISTAFEVVKKLNRRFAMRYNGEEWEAAFDGLNGLSYLATAATTPEAIVKAALMAVMELEV